MIRTVALMLALAGASSLWGQQVISARSGLIHYAEGDVKVTGEQVNLTAGKFAEVREGKILRTEQGRAEVLLNPGVFLRIGPDSTFKMISSQFTDTVVEMERGVALMEALEIAKGSTISVRVGQAVFQPLKPGLYHIDAEAREVRVFDGKGLTSLDGTSLKLGRGRVASLTPALKIAKFDRKKTDAMYSWTQRRSAVIAQANMNASFSAAQGGTRSRGNSMWAWYPSLGMFTFMPGVGRVYSPFGYSYYSPVYMWGYVINPPRVYAPTDNGSAAWAGRPSVGSYGGGGGSAAVAASSGDVGRSAPAPSAPAPSAGGGRDR